jgi:hypothetical protein
VMICCMSVLERGTEQFSRPSDPPRLTFYKAILVGLVGSGRITMRS